MPGIAPGEGAAPVLRATEPHLEALKPPGSCEDPLDKAGCIGLRPVHAAGKAGAEAVGCAAIEAIEPKGASLDTNTAPAPTESTATTAKPEALEP